MFACLYVRTLHIIVSLLLVGVFVAALAATSVMTTTVPEVAEASVLTVTGHAHSFGYPFMYLFKYDNLNLSAPYTILNPYYPTRPTVCSCVRNFCANESSYCLKFSMCG